MSTFTHPHRSRFYLFFIFAIAFIMLAYWAGYHVGRMAEKQSWDRIDVTKISHVSWKR
jgi:hypothetical protein